MRRLCAEQKMALLIGQISSFETKHVRLCALQVTNIDGLSQTIPVDDLLVFFGLSPKLGPIADWGLNIDRKQITVDTEKC